MSNLAYKYQQKQYEERPQQPSPSKLFKRKVTKGEKVLWSMAAVALLAASVYLVSTFATVYSLNSDIQKMETQSSQQQKLNHDKQQEIAELSAPERIFKIAKNKLGMTTKNGQVKVIGNE